MEYEWGGEDERRPERHLEVGHEALGEGGIYKGAPGRKGLADRVKKGVHDPFGKGIGHDEKDKDRGKAPHEPLS